MTRLWVKNCNPEDDHCGAFGVVCGLYTDDKQIPSLSLEVQYLNGKRQRIPMVEMNYELYPHLSEAAYFEMVFLELTGVDARRTLSNELGWLFFRGVENPFGSYPWGRDVYIHRVKDGEEQGFWIKPPWVNG
jgi:hypothetical protein